MEHVGSRWPFDAGDGTQVFVNSKDVMIGHVLEGMPGHDLEKIAVEWRREAVSSDSRGTRRMQVIQIDARFQDLEKLGEGPSPFRKASLVWC